MTVVYRMLTIKSCKLNLRNLNKLLVLINNLETINDEFENLNFSVCNELVKKGLSDLSTMPNDSNVNLVLQHYVKWKNTLSRI